MLKTGIIGLPNVGKSTLFNALTRSRKAEAGNFPFCTIDCNVGIITVPDKRLLVLQSLCHSKKIIPAALEIVDIAGLVAGASQGEGLGNKFLGHIREVDALVQVVRCFENDNIHHVEGSVDPIRDIEIIQTELLLADIASLEKQIERKKKMLKTGDKISKLEVALIEKFLPHLNNGQPATTLPLSTEEKKIATHLWLLTAKPILFAANVSETDFVSLLTSDEKLDHPYLNQVENYARDHHNTKTILMSAKIESELSELSPEDALEYLHSLGIQDSGVELLINSIYHLLNLRTYFTAGPEEIHAWTISAGDKAPLAAGVIHSDFQRGFIAAETISFSDFDELRSTAKCREMGKLRIEGKEYEVQDGDIIEFRFNV